MSLSKMYYPLLSTGSIQEDRTSPQHDRKSVDWDLKHQNKMSELSLF